MSYPASQSVEDWNRRNLCAFDFAGHNAPKPGGSGFITGTKFTFEVTPSPSPESKVRSKPEEQKTQNQGESKKDPEEQQPPSPPTPIPTAAITFRRASDLSKIPGIQNGSGPFCGIDYRALFAAALSGKIICIEGNIGAGKSTVGVLLVRVLEYFGIKCTYFPEPLDERGLKAFLADKPGRASIFQEEMLKKRVDTYKRAMLAKLLGHCVIVERSLPGDMAIEEYNFLDGNITPKNHAYYLQTVEMERPGLPVPDLILYLKLSSEILMDRIKARARAGEDTGYDEKYIKGVSACYERTLAHLWDRVVELHYDHHVSELCGQPEVVSQNIRECGIQVLNHGVKLLYVLMDGLKGPSSISGR